MSRGTRGGRWRRDRGSPSTREASPVPEPVSPRFVNAPGVETLPRIEPKIPWSPIALVVIALLWIPIALSPERDAVRAGEAQWIPPAESETRPGSTVHAVEREFSSRMTLRAVELEARVRGLQDTAFTEAGASFRIGAARRPSTFSALLFLLVFFALGRRMIGDAAAIVATALLASCAPFFDAARSAHPMLIAETLALAGIGWMIGIESRHREVGFTRWSALEATAAGVLFGASLAEHPATFPAVLAALIIWLSLGLRRSHAATLPERRPGTSAAYAWLGGAGLAATAALTIFGLEHSAGGTSRGFLASFSTPPVAGVIWANLYRWMVSPAVGADVLVIAAALVVATIAVTERSLGIHWRGAGLLPWIYLLLFVLTVSGLGFDPSRWGPIHIVSGSDRPTALPELPLPIPALLVLGLGWLVLRGFSPGRVRRQEYTFLLVWLTFGVVLFPLGVSADSTVSEVGHDASFVQVAITILPMVVLIAARAARAFWESEPAVLARIGILSFTCLPVLATLAGSVLRHASAPDSAPNFGGLASYLPIALGIAASLGVVSMLMTVRPDQPLFSPRRGAESGGDRGPRRRRHRGRPPRGRRPRSGRGG